MGIDKNDGSPVAIKVESTRTQHPQLYFEYRLYKLFQNSEGFPKVFHFGKESSKNCMVMELCGKSLEDLFQKCKCRFSVKTVIMIAVQAIKRLESMHRRGYVHRDIKPENFLIGRDDADSTVFLIDLGLAKKCMDITTKRHIPYREDKSLTGNLV